MANWLENIVLTGSNIMLEPLSIRHQEDLMDTVREGELWKLWYTKVPHPDEVAGFIQKAVAEMEKGQSHVFAIKDIAADKVIGSTRFLNLVPSFRRLEIGNTWYAKSKQRTGANTECKHLLLTFAFEELDCIAVEFRTHWHNIKSREAIARLGAKQDGVLRNHQINKDGTLRDTVVFSILQSEWPTVKKGLEFKMSASY